jgi:RNA polymerase sigma-70 factor (ECF subfamily)
VTDEQEERLRLAERALVVRAQAGDRAAFHDLVEVYQRRLTYYVHRLIGDAEQSRDLLQDVWIEVFRRFAGLRSPAAFRVWLYRVAHHRAIKHLRRKGVEARAEEVIVDAIDELVVDEHALLENAELVHHAMGQLTLDHREVLTLRFLEDLSIHEIAEVVGCSEGTAKSRLHYAKAAMRKIIEQEQRRG